VTELRVDPVRLAAGMISVLALEAVLPDGAIAVHPAPDGGDLQLDLAPLATRLQDGPLKIHLVVAAHREGASLVAGQLARYRSVEGGAVVDENTGDNGIALPRLRVQLGLYAGDAPSQNFISLPLVEVAHQNEGFELTSFVAPQLAVVPQSALARHCRDLLQRVRGKAAFVAERLHAPGTELRQATLIELQHSLHCLVGSMTPFEAILESGVAHPFELYLNLCRLVGDVALFGAGVVPPLFPTYDHNDLHRSFEPLLSFCNRMLESVSETHFPIAFIYEDGAFRLMMDPAWLLRGELLIGVRSRPRQTEREVGAWINEAVIASSDRVEGMAETRVRGAARRQLSSEEDLEFLPARGTFIYRITVDRNVIAPQRVLVIVNPSDRDGERRPVEIVLHVPTDRRGAHTTDGSGSADTDDHPRPREPQI
jgi:type VI secretion system protein ImpJ